MLRVNSMLRQDLAYAQRLLSRERAFTIAVAFTLALGIGAAAAIFAAVVGILLRPLPVRDQDHLALLTVQNIANGDLHVGITNGLLSDLAGRSHSVEAAAGVPAALAAGPYAIRDGDLVLQLALTSTTGNFFQVLGAVPEQGRLLEQADDGGTNGPAAVLSYSAWRSVFGGRRDIVGHQIALDIGSFSIVGIAPRGFDYPRGTDVWLSDAEFMRLAGATVGPEDGYWDALIRLKPHGARDLSVWTSDSIRTTCCSYSSSNLTPPLAAMLRQVLGAIPLSWKAWSNG